MEVLAIVLSVWLVATDNGRKSVKCCLTIMTTTTYVTTTRLRDYDVTTIMTTEIMPDRDTHLFIACSTCVKCDYVSNAINLTLGQSAERLV